MPLFWKKPKAIEKPKEVDKKMSDLSDFELEHYECAFIDKPLSIPGYVIDEQGVRVRLSDVKNYYAYIEIETHSTGRGTTTRENVVILSADGYEGLLTVRCNIAEFDNAIIAERKNARK